MKVSAIVMDPEAAEAKLRAYRKGLEGRHSAAVEEEWKAAENAYRELAKGTPLLDPLVAISEAGWRPDGRPQLAIARADFPQVQWSVREDSRRWHPETRIFSGSWAPMSWRFQAIRNRGETPRARSTQFIIREITAEPPAPPTDGVAMVPMVPPDVMPARGCDLSKHFVLWEVENWDAAPPIDPMLLRPIGGDLYAVIAQWDLTDLERAIIKGTRRI